MTRSLFTETLARNLETQTEALRTHLTDCVGFRKETTQAIRDTKKAIQEVRSEIEAFKKLPFKAVRWLGSIIVIAIISVLVQNFFLHRDSVKATQLAADEAASAAEGQQQVIHQLNRLEQPLQSP